MHKKYISQPSESLLQKSIDITPISLKGGKDHAQYFKDNKSVEENNFFALSNKSYFIENLLTFIESDCQDKEVLELFSKHPSTKIKRAVASNIFTHPLTLSKLAKSEDIQTKVDVASNIAADYETRVYLSNDKNILVRRAVARCHATESDILTKLSTDKADQVRSEVALNINTPKKIRKILFFDPSETVRADSLLVPDVPLWLLKSRYTDKSKLVRLCVASIDRTPVEIIEKLSNDSDLDVAFAAKQKLLRIESFKSEIRVA